MKSAPALLLTYFWTIGSDPKVVGCKMTCGNVRTDCLPGEIATGRAAAEQKTWRHLVRGVSWAAYPGNEDSSAAALAAVALVA